MENGGALLVGDDELLLKNEGTQVSCIGARITSTLISTHTLYTGQVYDEAVVVGLRGVGLHFLGLRQRETG
eukprot:evm.model.NODE_37492_length_23513_cov_21.405945.5